MSQPSSVSTRPSRRPRRRRGEFYLVLWCPTCKYHSILRHSERADTELARCPECLLMFVPEGSWR